MARRAKPAVAKITTARPSLSEDVAQRTRRYLVLMGIRTVCFVLAIFVPGWPRWVFIAGAVLLPYISVVFANAGREPNRSDDLPAVPDDLRAIEPGPSRTDRPGPGNDVA